MCYVIYLSTTSGEDFTQLPTDLYRFEHADGTNDAEPVKLLHYANKWVLICRHGGCSCHYRHSVASDRNAPEFGPPEDWCPEDADDIESTSAVYDCFARILAEGHRLDVLDNWNGENLDSIKSPPVSLAAVPRESFKFFENYRFDLYE